jgi:alpha-glucosidase (family GH31 glycosyl hydrolase)
LAEEVQLTPAEATIGEPYVSDDIGSYLGPPPNGPAEPQSGTKDPPDLNDRWVQFGTFQPIMRLHSNDENRLPWQYPEPVSGITEDFLRLREALLPYTYTLAAQAHQDGMPITQPLYLDYPGQAQAYVHPDEYLYGSDVLVAPVITPGSDAQTSVWIPPGRWIDYFTGATFTGPSTTTVSAPLSRMPVFVRAGGIIPEQASSGGSATTSPTQLDVKVFSGAAGTFTLYEDSGSGLGYTKGQFTETQISDSLDATGQGQANGTSRVTIGAAHGHYPGEPARVSYRIEMIDTTAPVEVTLNGSRLESRTSGSNGPGWYYEAATSTVVITTSEVPTSRALTVVMTGGAEVMRTEPTAAAS